MSSAPTDHDPNTPAAPSEPPSGGGKVVIAMPQMGVSVAEGTVSVWHKQPGDWVDADETVCDVTTDKIDVEIPSPESGRLTAILVQPGETVAVGTPLAELDAAARPGEAHPDEHAPGAPTATPETSKPIGPSEPSDTPKSDFHSPAVRRLAREHEIDLNQVEGHGRGGRIRRTDLLAHIEAEGTVEAQPQRSGGHQRPLHTESPYKPDAPATQSPANPSDLLGPTRREALSPMRKQIAKHMLESRRAAAHATTIVEVDFSRVAKRRAELREEMRRKQVPLTYLAFVAEATIGALQRFPILNASLDGDEVVMHDDVNLGIAVALDQGLVVPVIHQAQQLSLEGLASAIAELAGRARSGQLVPDDVSGGTFTITNPGQFGAVLATPIINQPQSAILDLEAIVKRPVVIDDGAGGDSIAVRPISYLCMSWDHRVLDGADAARFLGAIKTTLEGVDH